MTSTSFSGSSQPYICRLILEAQAHCVIYILILFATPILCIAQSTLSYEPDSVLYDEGANGSVVQIINDDADSILIDSIGFTNDIGWEIAIETVDTTYSFLLYSFGHLIDPGIFSSFEIFPSDTAYVHLVNYDGCPACDSGVSIRPDTMIVKSGQAEVHTDSIVIHISKSVRGNMEGYINQDHYISVWPNPSNNMAKIKIHNYNTNAVIIYDNMGRKIDVVKDSYYPSSEILRIDTRKLSSGMYFIAAYNVIDSTHRIVKTFIVQH